ncbi:MAG: 7-cyano-7-deazaguanine synthase QueC [Bacteroidota bacterium]
MSREKGIVLVSGGMDSCVTAAMAHQTHELSFLHLNYGQRTERRELQAFTDIADHYGVTRRLVVSMEHLAAIGGSSLTDPAIPVSRANLASRGIPTSYVPFRNANMLAVAVSWAEEVGAHAIFIGAVEEDSSGYPDCRREFYDAFEAAIRAGTKSGTQIRLVTPVIGLRKSDIVSAGLRLAAPLHLTWSCYTREDVACGVCDSCALRLRGFRLAGSEDPLPYETRPVYE